MLDEIMNLIYKSRQATVRNVKYTEIKNKKWLHQNLLEIFSRPIKVSCKRLFITSCFSHLLSFPLLYFLTYKNHAIRNILQDSLDGDPKSNNDFKMFLIKNLEMPFQHGQISKQYSKYILDTHHNWF